ncbi:co-chaperone GroES [Sporosalibacterium faouarense]|uniref:co-chaperone GroES n=1 Tax=Sporosalibacterium faouarense TaxID=516123 RepID=UPI00141D00C8|nr:co-chaperone GroES [Sporosalibacterium faouarense]MTI46748.1 co-chaperone GroES [Bacillota bacterium]
MTIKPLGDRVVIKKVELEETTKSGIVLPNSAKEEPKIAEIVAVGPKVEEKGELKVGDKVIFSKFSGTDVKADGVEYTILKSIDILAIVD